jgi:hypothetical protein
MGILDWFKTQEVDELAAAIAAELVKRVPPAALESRTRKAAERLRNTHEAIFGRAGKFARTHPLSVYQRARLGNQFRWALKEAGYPPEFVESWTYELAIQITLDHTPRRAPGG